MKKILFVCLGNICRSPVAEGIFNKKVRDAGLSGKLVADSAGTANYHTGETPHSTSTSVASEYGVTLQHRARQFSVKDFTDFDLILCMDRSNYQIVSRMSNDPLLLSKVGMMGQFFDSSNPAPVERSRDVPDPYYGSLKGFHDVHQLLDAATNNLLTFLKTPAL